MATTLFASDFRTGSSLATDRTTIWMLFEFNAPFEEFWGLTLRQTGALTMSYATPRWATPHPTLYDVFPCSL